MAGCRFLLRLLWGNKIAYEQESNEHGIDYYFGIFFSFLFFFFLSSLILRKGGYHSVSARVLATSYFVGQALLPVVFLLNAIL